jgi:hypothetical protein
VITDVDTRYYGLVINDQSLTPGANQRIGATSLGFSLRSPRSKGFSATNQIPTISFTTLSS